MEKTQCLRVAKLKTKLNYTMFLISTIDLTCSQTINRYNTHLTFNFDDF